MAPWLIALAVLAAPLALYGLHRLALWLEARGHLYYKYRKPEGGGASRSLLELQQALDPTTKHVLHVKEQKRRHSEGEAPGGPDAVQ